MKQALVCGAGGFIGSHVVRRLKADGFWVRGLDLKFPEFSETAADDFVVGDLRDQHLCQAVVDRKFDEVYQFAADMGGAGYIFIGEHDADIMHNSATINLNMVDACRRRNIRRVFYSSSACMYPAYNQEDPENPNCAEGSAYPAAPDSEYGWRSFLASGFISRSIVIMECSAASRDITIYSAPKAPGRATGKRRLQRYAERSPKRRIAVPYKYGAMATDALFLFIDECIEGTLRLTRSQNAGPFNIGSDEMVSINRLAKMVMDITGKKLEIEHIHGPLGVRGRSPTTS